MKVSRIKFSNWESSPECSRIVVGAWRLLNNSKRPTPQDILRFIETAVEVGMTTFDHADIYGNYEVEQAFGQALKLNPSLKNRIEIVTKTGIKLISSARPSHRIKSYDAGRAHLTQAVEHSLSALGVESLDLLLIHRPDHLANPDEIAETFTKLKSQGKCKSFGVSNHSAAQFERLQSRLDFPLVTNQIELSPFEMSPLNDGILDQCLVRRISPMAWSPLGGGKLFDPKLPQSQKLKLVFEDILSRRSGLPKAAGIEHVCLAWLLAHPARIVPVIGTTHIERIQSAGIAEEIQLSREEWYEIWQAAAGREVP